LTTVTCTAPSTGTFTRTTTYSGPTCTPMSTDNSGTACKPFLCSVQPTITTPMVCPAPSTGTYTVTTTFNSAPLVCAYNLPTDDQATACLADYYYTQAGNYPTYEVYCAKSGACKAGTYQASLSGCTTSFYVPPSQFTVSGSYPTSVGPTKFAFAPMDVSIIPFSCR